MIGKVWKEWEGVEMDIMEFKKATVSTDSNKFSII